MENKAPRILFLDIETTHNIAAVFDLTPEYIQHTNLLSERFIVCACWKYLGEDKIHSTVTFTGNDHNVVKDLCKVISEADVIVGHNLDQFDMKMIKTRALFHDMKPLPPVSTIDTYKVAKQAFRFNSNKLDYLAKFMGFGGKKHTDAELWLQVLKGNKKSIKIMLEYNKRDVELQEKVFLKLRPYVPNHINRELFGKTDCPRCGSHKVQSRGVHKAISRVYRRFQCQACSGWFRSVINDKTIKPKYRVL